MARFSRSVGPSSFRLMLRWCFLIFERMDLPILGSRRRGYEYKTRSNSGSGSALDSTCTGLLMPSGARQTCEHRTPAAVDPGKSSS